MFVMSSRGRGSCPRCYVEYFNRSKRPNCGNFGHHLGGTFQGVQKKTKSASPAVLEITQGIFSCRTTGRDDQSFVTSSGDMWLCTHEVCKVSLRKQRFGLQVRVRPREACKEHRHRWSPCYLLTKYFELPMQQLHASDFE